METLMNAVQFNDALESVRYCLCNLNGCTVSERPNEARLLRASLNTLCAAKQVRKNSQQLARRAVLIKAVNARLAELAL